MDEMSLFDFIGEPEKFAKLKSGDWSWSMENDYPAKNGLKVFSCFACGGGSTMGYKLAGCEVLGCCEIDPKMNKVYLHNHKPKYNFLMDIRAFNELKKENLPAELYDLDVLDGSPPCTTFSMAGQREESWGKLKKFREGQAEQTLDDLSFVFIDTVKKLRPKVAIIENVEGLLLGNAWEYVRKMYEQLKTAGYQVNHWLLKGETMGVPQKRHRVFFICVRGDLNVDPHELDMTFDYEPITYAEIKSGAGEEINHDTQVYKMLKMADRSHRSIADVYASRGEKKRNFSAAICWPENVLPTIPAKIFHCRGEECTRISTQDVIHVQTFPNDYDFMTQNPREIEYICGMSVPPVMIKRIMLRLIEQGVFDYKLKKGGESQ